MTNEYLFTSEDDLEKIQALETGDVCKNIIKIENSPLWILSLECPGDNEKNAKKLSALHGEISAFSPLVLTCESSEYFNRVLFPLLNKLERKLRKLLYLAASISDNDAAKANIKKLEEKSFGDIFNLLFVDENFIKEIKSRVNADQKGKFNGQGRFSKSEILEFLNGLDEHTLWDEILEPIDVPTLRQSFRKVQYFRNDVMHAHNIDHDAYSSAKKIISAINTEIDNTIDKFVVGRKGESNQSGQTINHALSSALQSYSEYISNNIKSKWVSQVSDNIQMLSENLKSLTNIEELRRALSEKAFYEELNDFEDRNSLREQNPNESNEELEGELTCIT